MNNYKYLGKLKTISIVFMLSALVMSHKIVQFCGIQFSVASLIFPNTILIANVVAFAYGHKQSSEIMLETLKSQIPFIVICFVAINCPSPETFTGEVAYSFVFKDLWQISLASLLGTYLGFKGNTYALSNFNFLLRYQLFWFRTLFACGVGEIVFSITAVPLMFFNKVEPLHLVSIVMTSIVVKLLYSSFFSYFSERLAKKIMEKEGIETVENKFSYDPFILN